MGGQRRRPGDPGRHPGRPRPRSPSAGVRRTTPPMPPRRTGWRPGRRPRRCVPPCSPSTWHRDGRPANPSTAAATAAGDGASPVSSRTPATAPHRFQALCRPGTRSRRPSDQAGRRRPRSTRPAPTRTRPRGRTGCGRDGRRCGGPPRSLPALTASRPGRPGLDQAQLVPVVGLDAAVPVEVVGGEAGEHHHPGRAGHVGRLVRGDLDHVGVGSGPAVGLEHRHPDVPDQLHPTTVGLEDGGGQRRRRALALGPGDGQHRCVGVVLEPHRHGRGHRRSGGLGRDQLGAVPADPRATGPPRPPTTSRRRRAGATGRAPPRAAATRAAASGIVVDQDRRRRPGRRPGRRRPDPRLPSPRPPPGGRAPRRASTGHGLTACSAQQRVDAPRPPPGRERRAASSAARSRATSSSPTSAEATGASAATTTESRQPGRVGQQAQGGGRLASLPHALERLVGVAHQGGEPRRPGPGRRTCRSR